MKRIAFFLFFFIGFTHLSHTITLSPQDHYRYQAIELLLKQYQRPVTCLELFAQNAQLSCHIAQHNNAVCVIQAAKHSKDIIATCQQKNVKNIVVLNTDLSTHDLRHLGECEHIDVIIVPDVTQLFSDNWQQAITALLTLGDHFIIETPPYASPLHGTVCTYLREQGGTVAARPEAAIAQQAGTLFFFSIEKKYLIKRRWRYDQAWRLGEYTVVSTFTEKKLIKEKRKPAGKSITDWHAGINLYTFKKLHGAYPTTNEIRNMLMPLGSIAHNDLRIFNIILQGKKVVPIDCNESGRPNKAIDLLPLLLSFFKKKQ